VTCRPTVRECSIGLWSYFIVCKRKIQYDDISLNLIICRFAVYTNLSASGALQTKSILPPLNIVVALLQLSLQTLLAILCVYRPIGTTATYRLWTSELAFISINSALEISAFQTEVLGDTHAAKLLVAMSYCALLIDYHPVFFAHSSFLHFFLIYNFTPLYPTPIIAVFPWSLPYRPRPILKVFV